MSTSIFSGTVQHVRYNQDDFYILALVLDGSKNFAAVAAKGNFPAQSLKDGTWVSFEGEWVNDARYGRQLRVIQSPVAIDDWTDDRVLAALTSHEIGPTYRSCLRSHAIKSGQDISDILDSGDLSQVDGFDDLVAQLILMRWQGIRTYLDAASFMADAGIPAKIVTKVWQTFGTDIQGILMKDPWVLVQVPGITFAEVDTIAIRLGLGLENPGRMRGAVLASIQEAVHDGHVFASVGQVVSLVERKVPGETPPLAEIAIAIKELSESKGIRIDRDTAPEFTALYDNWHYDIEVACAEMLAVRQLTPIDDERLARDLCQVGDRVRDARDAGADTKGLAKAALENWAVGRKTALSDFQMEAALAALTSQVSLLTGLPGTGKTTTLQAVVAIAQDARIPFLLVAPTGIAAKRMTSVTGAEAHTVHRAFGASGFMGEGEERESTYAGITGSSVKKTGAEGGGEWEYGLDNPHPARFMIVDESSMLDINMLYRLLTGTSPDCRIMFVGDPYQLPSVGAGDVLRNLGEAKVFAHSHLTRIFRQEGTSGIVLAAHAIHAGKAPVSDGKDFLIVESSTEDDAAAKVVAIAKGLYDKRINFQVLSPRHGGDAGVTALNQRLRFQLNPSEPGLGEMRMSGSLVRVSDRVMIVKNDYDLGVFNGDVGKVSRIDTKKKKIEVKVFEGGIVSDKVVTYDFKDASKSIRLAYAQTVHKSQGQEYDMIVIPVLPQFGRQLQRNLLYTAITRAKQKVFIVGTGSAVRKAVRNNKSAKRNTLLVRRLQILLGSGGTL